MPWGGPAAMTVRGRFITFEGIDGAGKSSHIEPLAAWLRERGHAVLVTREPGGTPLAEALRDLVLHQPMDALTESLLVFAARRDHLTKAIQPALDAGTTVLCDRFDLLVLSQLEGMVHSGLQPDLTLWFDLPPAVAAQRRAAARAADRFEAESTAFFERVHAGYAARVAAQPARFTRIDALPPQAEVRTQVCAAVQAVLR
jgi:dTMP kinase